MMSGEFDYGSIFLENGKVPFPTVTYFMSVVFFLLLSIVTLNLLVGLTVDDIQTFLDEADLKNLKLKLKFVLGIEKFYSRLLPNFYFLKLITKQKLTLIKDTGRMHVDDVVSKRRIWQQILKKSIEDIKKTELEQILEEHKILKGKVESMESLLRSINTKLGDAPESKKETLNKVVAIIVLNHIWKPKVVIH